MPEPHRAPSRYAAEHIAFETERTRVRGYALSDADDAFAMYRDPEMMKFLVGAPVITDLAAQRRELQRIIAVFTALPPGFGAFAVEDKASGRVIGTALFKPAPMADGSSSNDAEIGWHVVRAQWGRGYASEVGRGLIAHGHQTMHIARLIALVEDGNDRSLGVVRRIGMRPAGITNDYYGGEELMLFESIASEDT